MAAEADSLLLTAPGPSHARAPSSTSTAEIVEAAPCCQCQPSGTVTLRSNASDSLCSSSYSCNTLGQSRRPYCPACDHNLRAYSHNNVSESSSFMPPTTPVSMAPSNCGGHDHDCGEDEEGVSMRRSHARSSCSGYNTATTYVSEDEDSVFRYSFKGIPPEMYSAKKEFIYRRPLVEKQLVLKKTCEWWFYRNKCSNMSTHWKHNAILIPTTCILILLGLIIFFSLPVQESETTQLHSGAALNRPTMMTTPTTATAITTASASTTLATARPFAATTIASATALSTTKSGSGIPESDEGGGGSASDGDIDAGGGGGGNFYDNTDVLNYNASQTFEGDGVDWTAEDDLSNDIQSDFDDIYHSIPDEYTSDYVTPVKFHNFTLNSDDLLYESRRNLDNNNNNDFFSAFSETGTFRSKSSQIWDPHPEYILNAFGKTLHLVLHQDTSFIPPETFRVINILNNRTEEEDVEEGHYLGCYYKGYVQGDEQSAVAVSLCHGMTGYIKTSFGSLLIQPVNNQTNSDASSANANASGSSANATNASTPPELLHKVWRHSRRDARHTVSALDIDLAEFGHNGAPKLTRKKRNYDNNLYTIELLVAVDRTMIEFHKDDLKSYILTLISIVSNVFADASIGNPIGISVANILQLQDFKRPRRKSGQTVLEAFCTHVATNGFHYDTAMLITRDKICRKDRETRCDTLGLAELGTVCRRKSCSIVQDNGLPAAFTIAHELGHILNMPHDDDSRCQRFYRPGVKRRRNIMSSVMERDIHPWSWSDCSRHYVSEFLEKEDTSCLEDEPTKFIRNYNTLLPGEIYSLDHQCKLIHGNQSVHCPHESDCRLLWCKSHYNQPNCRSSQLPWADGTPCNNNRYWCQKGECVPREGHVRQAIHGGWGPWSMWSTCSLSCGGGVQESTRECDSPLPKNGGKYCTGSRKKYRSCNTQNCPPGSLDAREEQCHRMNGRDFGIKGIGPDTKWIPKYGLSSNDKCNLYCRGEGRHFGYFRLSDKVIDGTTCSFDTFDKCINGVCRPAGCDNELNSIAKLDKCGVCEGRNDTCEDVVGHFYVSDLLVPKNKSYFYHVTTIPKGASNIVIEQPGHHDENYIVLRDDQDKSLLNGDQLLTAYHNVSYYAGVAYEYNGSNSTIERVNTTFTKKLKRELRVELISLISNFQRERDTLLLTYKYTIDKSVNYVEQNMEIYRWEMQKWSNCDALCHGSMHRLPVCMSATQGLKVSPQFCDMQAKPPTEYRACYLDCKLSLNISGISECSAFCGMLGTREKDYQCIQTFTDGRSNIVDLKYCAEKFDIQRHEECREGCWQYTDWMPCSTTCGYGVQTRSVGCYFNNSFVDDEYCNARTKILLNETTRMCSQETCIAHQPYVPPDSVKISRSIPNNWWAGEWGHCDDKCEKNRTVMCRSPQGIGCSADRKPLTRRKCCTIKYVSNWSSCSVQCGNGVRHKEMHCARVYKAEIKGAPRQRERIDPSYCRNMRMPKPKRMHKPCKVSCRWSMTSWTQCASDCSEEYQSRSVYCESVFGNPINHTYCDAAKKPPVRKICNNCVKRESKILSGCNCEGYRRRRIVCYDSRHERIPCPTKEKIIREKCHPPRHCYPSSCYELQRYHNIRNDGDYTLYIRSIPLRIYCHDMRTSSPKEYVSVNATENYSIYYDQKTQTPDECPPVSRLREYPDPSLRGGRTSFRKIRIDIGTLRVYDNDFTFADTVGTPQTYGSAGDCYNRLKQCPQGDFSINLEHTGFRLRHDTIWEAYGRNVVMKETPSRSLVSHRALCGGWCGGCRIAGNSALYLNV